LFGSLFINVGKTVRHHAISVGVAARLVYIAQWTTAVDNNNNNDCTTQCQAEFPAHCFFRRPEKKKTQKMLKLVVCTLVALLVASTRASDHDCDDLTALKVQQQWARAYSHGHNREHFAEAVWRTAFNLSPDLKERLHARGADDLSSGKFRAFALGSLSAVEMAVTFLNNPEALKAEFDILHQRQVDRHIPDEFIDVFLKALGHVVPAQLGRCWDREAWKVCFKVIGDGLKGH